MTSITFHFFLSECIYCVYKHLNILASFNKKCKIIFSPKGPKIVGEKNKIDAIYKNLPVYSWAFTDLPDKL